MNRPMSVLKVVIAGWLFMAATVFASHRAEAESKQEDKVRQILVARNAELRAALLKAWLVPSDLRRRSQVEALAVDIYASEMRLHALGIERKAVAAGVSVVELPYFVLADRARIDIDVWSAFAGRTFALPAELPR